MLYSGCQNIPWASSARPLALSAIALCPRLTYASFFPFQVTLHQAFELDIDMDARLRRVNKEIMGS